LLQADFLDISAWLSGTSAPRFTMFQAAMVRLEDNRTHDEFNWSYLKGPWLNQRPICHNDGITGNRLSWLRRTRVQLARQKGDWICLDCRKLDDLTRLYDWPRRCGRPCKWPTEPAASNTAVAQPSMQGSRKKRTGDPVPILDDDAASPTSATWTLARYPTAAATPAQPSACSPSQEQPVRRGSSISLRFGCRVRAELHPGTTVADDCPVCGPDRIHPATDRRETMEHAYGTCPGLAELWVWASVTFLLPAGGARTRV
jgi:hypothetical protein